MINSLRDFDETDSLWEECVFFWYSPFLECPECVISVCCSYCFCDSGKSHYLAKWWPVYLVKDLVKEAPSKQTNETWLLNLYCLAIKMVKFLSLDYYLQSNIFLRDATCHKIFFYILNAWKHCVSGSAPVKALQKVLVTYLCICISVISVTYSNLLLQ